MTADDLPPQPAPGAVSATASLPLREYAYVHARTVGSTGYFSCEPAEALPLDAALTALEATPLDDFLHEHLLRRLGDMDAPALAALAERCLAAARAGRPLPALTALLLECALIFPGAGTALAPAAAELRAHAAPLETASPSPRLAAARRSDQAAPDQAALEWGRRFHANLTEHRPLPRLEESGLPLPHGAAALAQAMAQLQAPASGALAAEHARLAAREWPGGGRPPARETFARAMNALEGAGLVAGPEMRHEASLSPIALLRDWRIRISVRNGRHAHRLCGTATAYGRGLSLAAARASCAMEMVERASAYASIDEGGAHGDGEVLHRRAPLPLRRATATELARAGLRAVAPDDLPAEAPLFWVTARDMRGAAVLVPAQRVLLFCNLDEIRLARVPGSTGLASGNTPEEARFAALMEVIERDADATTPFCRHTCFTLRSRDPRIQGLLDDYAARGIRVQFQDITSEFGVPVYRCFVTGRDGSVVSATGAGLRGADAALSALTETPWPYSWATPAPHGVASGPGLAGLASHELESLPDWSLPTAQASLRLLENVLAAHGREVFHVELTRADLDIPVTRVLVPGLEPHADFDAFTRPAPRLFARQALLNEGAPADHPLFRV